MPDAINADEAALLLDLIEAGTDGTWPTVRTIMVEERGYEPADLIRVTAKAAQIAGRMPILSEADFE